MTLRDPRPHRAGFTLIELLVVIGIITMLAGLLIGGVMVARGTANKKAVLTFINALDSAIETYEPTFGDYPPGKGDAESAELLYIALTSEEEGHSAFSFKKSQLTDLDNDDKPEICDHWRQPLVYMHGRHFDDEMDAPKGKRFLIISAGPDGEFEDGEGDDITNWQ